MIGSPRLRVALDRANMIAAWLVLAVLLMALTGLVAGVPDVVALFDWLDPVPARVAEP